MNNPKELGKILDESFDRIFVINLDQRKDRWSACKELFETYGITNYERFSGVRYTSLTEVDLRWWHRFRPLIHPGAFENWCKFMKVDINMEKFILGACGCKKSGHEVLKLIKKRSYKRALILQDDIGISKKARDCDLAPLQLRGRKLLIHAPPQFSKRTNEPSPMIHHFSSFNN